MRLAGNLKNRTRGPTFFCSCLILIRRERRHGKRLSARRAGEESRPASAPKRGPRRGPHLHFDMLGGRNNQNQRGRASKLCSRPTHYRRRNVLCTFTRTTTLHDTFTPTAVDRPP